MTFRVSTVFAVAQLSLAGCNCGRQPTVMKTEASLSLPVEVLDFGVVPEGTSKGLRFQIDNVGRASVNITATIASGSMDFRMGAVPPKVDAAGFVEIPIVFTPVGAGLDEAVVEIKTDKADELPLKLSLRGGPIYPALTFDPDPLSFVGATRTFEQKAAQLKSTGNAALTVRSIGVAANGNPDFAVSPPMTPMKLMPGDSTMVTVEYSRSIRVTEGTMEVLSDDPDAGLKRLRLIPHTPTACSNLIDDDNDGMIDFPDDPGCQDPADNDEYNPAQCVNMAVQPCDAGVCGGTRTCTNGTWGRCGGCDAGVPPVDAGVPPVDAGAGCVVTGTWRVDGGAMNYQCCNLFGLGTYAVNIDIDRFNISPASTARPQPSHPGTTLTATGGVPMCGGSFTYQRVISGGCTETYRLVGQFTSANRFVGTYTAEFTGGQCIGDPQCGMEDCADQSWPIEAYR
jgi:hypothetical protein